eukprot:7603253-Pyramimonas_sp.AAC.1
MTASLEFKVHNEVHTVPLTRPVRRSYDDRTLYAHLFGINWPSNTAGTAGKPILSAIEGSGIEGVAVLVTRYARP